MAKVNLEEVYAYGLAMQYLFKLFAKEEAGKDSYKTRGITGIPKKSGSSIYKTELIPRSNSSTFKDEKAELTMKFNHLSVRPSSFISTNTSVFKGKNITRNEFLEPFHINGWLTGQNFRYQNIPYIRDRIKVSDFAEYWGIFSNTIENYINLAENNPKAAAGKLINHRNDNRSYHEMENEHTYRHFWDINVDSKSDTKKADNKENFPQMEIATGMNRGIRGLGETVTLSADPNRIEFATKEGSKYKVLMGPNGKNSFNTTDFSDGGEIRKGNYIDAEDVCHMDAGGINNKNFTTGYCKVTPNDLHTFDGVKRLSKRLLYLRYLDGPDNPWQYHNADWGMLQQRDHWGVWTHESAKPKYSKEGNTLKTDTRKGSIQILDERSLTGDEVKDGKLIERELKTGELSLGFNSLDPTDIQQKSNAQGDIIDMDTKLVENTEWSTVFLPKATTPFKVTTEQTNSLTREVTNTVTNGSTQQEQSEDQHEEETSHKHGWDVEVNVGFQGKDGSKLGEALQNTFPLSIKASGHGEYYSKTADITKHLISQTKSQEMMNSDSLRESESYKVTREVNIDWNNLEPTGKDEEGNDLYLWKYNIDIQETIPKPILDVEGNPIVDENGKEIFFDELVFNEDGTPKMKTVKRQRQIYPTESYKFAYSVGLAQPTIPSIKVPFVVTGVPGSLSDQFGNDVDNHIYDAITWAKRANYADVLGYEKDNLVLASEIFGTDQKGVVVDGAISLNSEPISHTIELDIYGPGLDLDDEDIQLAKAVKLDAKNEQRAYEIAVSQTLTDGRRENRLSPGSYEDHSKSVQDIFIQDNSGRQMDIFKLGSGNDRVDLKGRKDYLEMGNGNDIINTKKGQQLVSAEGEKGDDLFINRAKLGTFNGGPGKDTARPRNGTTYFTGGRGSDTFDLRSMSKNSSATFSDFVPGTDQVKSNKNHEISFIKNLGLIKLESSNNKITTLSIGQETNNKSSNTQSFWRDLVFSNLNVFKDALDIDVWDNRDYDIIIHNAADTGREYFVKNKLFYSGNKLVSAKKFMNKVRGKNGHEAMKNIIETMTPESVLSNKQERALIATNKDWLLENLDASPTTFLQFINSGIENQMQPENI